MKLRICAAAVILICSLPSSTLAAPNLNRVITPPGTVSVAFYNGMTIQAYLEANKSYACTLQESIPDEADGVAFSASAQIGSNQLQGRLIGDVTPVNTAGTPNNIRASRLSLTPTESGMHFLSISSAIVYSSFIAYNGIVSCVETSIYGGFNTNVSEYNFLELTNTTNSAISVKIRALSSEGTVVIDNSTATIEPGVRKDIDLHSLVGAGKYGSVVVMHDGPFGAIKGVVSQYKVQPDGSYLPAQSTPLSTRSDVAPNSPSVVY